mmetsp:Transcript_11312/g.20904  ORF Transcript_11312/g.20904 Transcript_11312/m.20904 type:complete len:286 (+) Transcript_11312:96-953(+)
MDQVKAFLSGGFGGMCLVAVGHPLDTVKVRLQTSSEYSGMTDCFKKTVAKEGVAGLYKGMGAPLAGITPVFAIYFWGFEVGKQIARKAEGKEEGETLSTLGTMFAGGFSALPGTALLVPGDRIKIILQAQDAANPKYNGPIDVAKSLWKEGGMRSLYKGSALTLLRDGPGSVAYYGAYDIMKQKMTAGDPTAPLSPFKVIFAGGMAGVFNWIVAVPADVLKSRYQLAADGRYPGGLRQVASELIAAEGVGALYKGLVPALARAFPANAACFLGVETSKKVLDRFM